VLQDPSYYKAIVAALAQQGLQDTIVVVDPLVLSRLGRVALGGQVNNEVTFLPDTFPSSASARSPIQANVTLRNDGWNTLPSGTPVCVNITLPAPPNQCTGTSTPLARSCTSLNVPLNPTGVVSLPLGPLAAPANPGSYILTYGLEPLELFWASPPVGLPLEVL
jgi:hypothetical protein